MEIRILQSENQKKVHPAGCRMDHGNLGGYAVGSYAISSNYLRRLRAASAASASRLSVPVAGSGMEYMQYTPTLSPS